MFRRTGRPLRSAHATGHQRYYGPIRPFASHRYSAPHGSSTCGLSLRIEAEGSHVPHESLDRARAAFMPVTARTEDRRPPSSVPGQRLEPGFDDIPTLSTLHRRFTRVRLPDPHLTSCPAFSVAAHHPGRCARAAPGGLRPDPDVRSRGAIPHLSCSKAAQVGPFSLPVAPSWRTVVRIAHDDDLAPRHGLAAILYLAVGVLYSCRAVFFLTHWLAYQQGPNLQHFAGGLILGYVFLRTGLAASIAAHAGGNAGVWILAAWAVYAGS